MKAFALSLLLLTGSSISAASEDAVAREWLKKSWQASGGEAWSDVVNSRVEFRLLLPGLEGTGVAHTDQLSGRTHSVGTIGPMQFAEGFDGEIHWQQDTSGQVQKMDSPGELETRANSRFQNMNAQWYPDRWPATIVDLGQTAEGNKVYRRIGITPQGGRQYRLWIDEASGLIERQIDNDGSRDNTTFMSEYVDYGGRLIASKIRTSSGESKYDQQVILTTVEFNISLDEQLFAMPEPPPADFTLAGDAASAVTTFRLLNNHTYVKVSINGQGPFDFILDTGGVNVITPRLAEELGVSTQGKLEARGVGNRSQDLALAQIETVGVGDATVRDQVFFVLDFDQLSQAEGTEVQGLIGYEIFKRFAVRLDYEHSELTLFDPAKFTYSGNGVPIPFEFDGRTPVVDGTIDGLPGKLTFDPGSRGYISLHAPFVEENGRWEKHPEAIEGIAGWGVGGPTRSKILRGRSLIIGDSIVVKEPIMTLSLQQSGAFTDRYQIANLGAGILSHFNLVFDYQRQVVYFENHAGTSRFDDYDQAGVWLNDVGDLFEVMGVVEGGPAFEAGLQAGDQITRIDRQPSKDLFLPDLRVSWRSRQPDTAVAISYLRGNQESQTTMVLRDLIPSPRKGGGDRPSGE